MGSFISVSELAIASGAFTLGYVCNIIVTDFRSYQEQRKKHQEELKKHQEKQKQEILQTKKQYILKSILSELRQTHSNRGFDKCRECDERVVSGVYSCKNGEVGSMDYHMLEAHHDNITKFKPLFPTLDWSVFN